MPRYDESIRYDERLAYGRWQPPARSAADVWRGFPAWWTGPDDPARDGMGAGLVAVFNLVASTAARMSRMHLRAHAKGWALDLVARAAGLARADGEADWQLRARLAEVEYVVSPTAVASAVHALLPEAIVVREARGFAMAVQWHPEWNAANDPVSRPLFQAFGTAVSGHARH